jgi:aspartate oxidase
MLVGRVKEKEEKLGMSHNSKGNTHVIIIGNGIAGNTAAAAISEIERMIS